MSKEITEEEKRKVEKMIDDLMKRAKKASEEYMALDQETVDRITKKMAMAGLENHMKLAKMAVEETGRGIYEDKITKNMFASEYVYHSIKYDKTVGIINDLPISKVNADESMDSASCIGCGACVAACKNGSAMLFVSAKISQLALLPQGAVEKDRRVRAMVAKMDELGFGNCTNTGACSAECPKNIKLYNIGRMNRHFIAAKCKE